MDVKYRSNQWDKTKDSLRNLIGLGVWGKGMIDTMKDITDNLDEVSEKVAKYDSDGVVSFSYTSDKDKYQRLFEDFKVLEDFSGNVGDIVEDTIDQPFYEDIDAFVQKVRDSSISNYTTSNHIGATETIPISYYGSYQEYETEKTEITIDDILSGDNYYADQIKTSFEEWKVQNPDEDISYEDYRTAAVNTRAFEYESIEDGQFTKEFWVNIAALVVIVGVTVVCPPAGAVLGAAYATVEMGSAISGQDWASGRELDTSERWTRGLLAPLDVLPVGNAVTSFAGTARTTSKVIDVGQSASKVNKTNTAVQQADNVIELKIPADRLARTSNVDSTAGQADNVVSLADYANRQTANRLRNSQWAVKEQDRVQELQMAAGAEHLSAGNKMAGNSGPMMMRNDGVGPGGVGPVRGSGESVSSVSKTDSGSLHAGSIRASSETQPIIKYKEDYHVEHLTGEIKKCTDRRGVSGGHNYSEFKKFFETNGKYKLEEIQKFAHPEIEGIYDLEYRMLVEIKDYRGIGTGEYKYIPKENRDPLKKTIYDPDFISDEDIVRYGKEAMEEGIKNGQVDELIDQNKSMVSGTASNGLKFEGIKNLETGEIDNFWPVLEWSER
ncbi:CdiA family toxin C-terminal domain-containing protein [Terribacillus saccharophilus]|uniref:CdiA family toxin C-terminal domain-containing protein n=1 Tax=Terribacillus saccharophilus TaxID=361277 RepID=UPI002DC7704B|nr:EndoU domain-containing protein [Terribacillus saccharophilus]MEC0291627.1 EndoU domain-containing protein [Terribacillus saccharophilus]